MNPKENELVASGYHFINVALGFKAVRLFNPKEKQPSWVRLPKAVAPAATKGWNFYFHIASNGPSF